MLLKFVGVQSTTLRWIGARDRLVRTADEEVLPVFWARHPAWSFFGWNGTPVASRAFGP